MRSRAQNDKGTTRKYKKEHKTEKNKTKKNEQNLEEFKMEKIMLNVGVIGCGGMGRDHIRRLTEKIQGAEVVAVSDVFEECQKAAEICWSKKSLCRQ